MKNEVTKVVEVSAEEFGIDPKQAENLIGNLPQIKKERSELELQFDQIIKMDIEDSETVRKARELRLLIQKNRTKGINVWHKTTKDYFLKGGQFCDAIKRKEIAVNERMENDLLQIEKHAEIKEQKRLEQLQAKRVKQLSEFVEDAEERDLSSMDDDVWRAFLETKKKQHIDRLEAERKAEEERIAKEKAEAEERERIEKAKALHQERKDKLAPYWNFVPQDKRDMDFSTLTDDEFNERLNYSKSEKEKKDKEIEAQRKENERLKKESEERERLAKIEADKRAKRDEELRPYINFIRDYSKLLGLPDNEYEKEFADVKKGAEQHWEFERKKQAKEDAERKAREEKERKEREAQKAKLEAERKEREKLAAELEAKQEAERKAKEAEEARIQAELSKGDEDKISDLIADLNVLKTKYSFDSDRNKKKYANVGKLLDKVVSYIKD